MRAGGTRPQLCAPRPCLPPPPGPHGKPALDLAGEQCGDYSLETSLQACETHTLFFIISFKTCCVSGPPLSAAVTEGKGGLVAAGNRPLAGERRQDGRPQEPGNTEGGGAGQPAAAVSRAHVPEMAYRLECWYS